MVREKTAREKRLEGRVAGDRAVVVTTAHRGVFVGYAREEDEGEDEILLRRARMVVYYGAARRRAAEEAEGRALGARLRWALRRSATLASEAERAADVATGTVSHLAAGRRRGAGIGVLRRLAAALRVSSAWLVLGEGPAFWRVVLSGSAVSGGYLGESGDPTRPAGRREAKRWPSRREARSFLDRAGRWPDGIGGDVVGVRPGASFASSS